MIEGLTISLSDILALCAAISALYGVYKIWTEVKKPHEELRKKVEEHDERLKKLEEETEEHKKADKIILKALVALLSGGDTQHIISEINDYLINK